MSKYICKRNHNLVFGIDLPKATLIFLASKIPIKKIICTLFREKF